MVIDLCGIEFHGAVLSFGFALSKKPRVIGFCGASHVVVVEARQARKKPRKPSPRMVKRASANSGVGASHEQQISTRQRGEPIPRHCDNLIAARQQGRTGVPVLLGDADMSKRHVGNIDRGNIWRHF
jgi:hypothetical protein